MKVSRFLKELDDAQITAAIKQAEQCTSGEIRVYISDKSVEEPVEEAARQFHKLGMDKTALRNGVLIYVAPLSQTCAVIGDIGIHEKCGNEFWERTVQEMSSRLKQEDFTSALVAAISHCGTALAQHFPRGECDKDELPNQIARPGDPAS